MLSSFRTIPAFLLTTFLVFNLGACSNQDLGTEESIQSSDDQLAAAPAPSDEEKIAAEAEANNQKETEKALAEASSSDFTDPNEVQLNGMGSPVTSETPASLADVPVSTDSLNAIDGDNSIPPPEAPDLTTDSSSIASTSSDLTVYFAKSSSRVSREFRASLKDLAAKMKADKSLKIKVSGHCDNRGSPTFNRRLALKRAKAVKNYLVKLGVSRSQVTVASFGKEHLAQAGESEQEHKLNRRVEIENL